MKKDRWKKISRVFDIALTLPEERRENYIKQLCKGEPGLEEEVREMLDSAEESGQIFERFVDGNEALMEDLTRCLEPVTGKNSLVGSSIGNWKLCSLLGVGGMGNVYKAERVYDDIRQVGALKIMRSGFDTPENISRFRLEQQILAGLNHPNIASLIDGGISNDRLPYLVMEYVDGIPLTEYCDLHRLPLDKRLELFATVCRTVQYAHKNLIVHRDLKPENILVTPDGHIKILDFGIAKLLDPDTYIFSPRETRGGLRLMSLAYASPEQLTGDTINTGTDIYSLGILLYELITGAHPFQLEDQSFRTYKRAVLAREPAPPSEKFTESDREEIQDTFNMTVSSLTNRVRGDLDAIVVKALRKSPENRYDSASQFATDIEFYLKNEPVIARRDTTRYRISKFFQRYKKGAAASLLFVIALASVILFYTYRLSNERTYAQREARKAEQVTDFLMGLFNASSPNQYPGEEVTARELLDKGARDISNIDGDPALKSEMMRVMGNIYLDLGIYDKAEPFLKQALAISRHHYGNPHISTAISLNDLGMLYWEIGEMKQAKPLLMQAYQILDPGNRSPAQLATITNNLGLAFDREGKFDSAEVFFRKAIQLGTRYPSKIPKPVLGIYLNNLGKVLEFRGNLSQAEDFYRQSLDFKRQSLGENDTRIANSYSNLGRLFWRRGALDSAEKYHKKAFTIRQKLLDDDHEAIAQSLNNIAAVLEKKGDYAEAKSYYVKSINVYKKAFGDSSRFVGLAYTNLGRTYFKEGDDLDRARDILETGLRIYGHSLPDDHPWLRKNMIPLSRVYARMGRYDRAEELLRLTIAIQEKSFPEKKLDLAELQAEYGYILMKLNEYDKAEKYLSTGYKGMQDQVGNKHPSTQEVIKNLIKVYQQLDKPGRLENFENLLVTTAG